MFNKNLESLKTKPLDLRHNTNRLNKKLYEKVISTINNICGEELQLLSNIDYWDINYKFMLQLSHVKTLIMVSSHLLQNQLMREIRHRSGWHNYQANKHPLQVHDELLHNSKFLSNVNKRIILLSIKHQNNLVT